MRWERHPCPPVVRERPVGGVKGEGAEMVPACPGRMGAPDESVTAMISNGRPPDRAA